MINCLLLDTDGHSLPILEQQVLRVPFFNLLASCSTEAEFTAYLAGGTVDLLLLDVAADGVRGMDLLRQLSSPPLTIVVTHSLQYAAEAFQLGVIDYLLKPLTSERFLLAANKALERHTTRWQNRGTWEPLKDHLFVNAGYSQVKVRFQDICYIEGLRDYVKIHLLNAKPVVTRVALRDLVRRLPAGLFMRIHKSFIISLNLLEAVYKYKVTVGGTELPVGESYRNHLQGYISQRNL